MSPVAESGPTSNQPEVRVESETAITTSRYLRGRVSNCSCGSGRSISQEQFGLVVSLPHTDATVLWRIPEAVSHHLNGLFRLSSLTRWIGDGIRRGRGKTDAQTDWRTGRADELTRPHPL